MLTILVMPTKWFNFAEYHSNGSTVGLTSSAMVEFTWPDGGMVDALIKQHEIHG